MAPTDLQFSGSEQFDAPPRKLYALLTDLDAAGRFVPDLTAVEKIDERTMVCTARPGVSFLRGSLKLTVTLADLVQQRSATMQVTARGIGVEMQVVTRMEIEPADGGSRLDWTATVEKLQGLVATISGPLIRAAAERTVTRTWNQIRSELGETPGNEG